MASAELVVMALMPSSLQARTNPVVLDDPKVDLLLCGVKMCRWSAEFSATPLRWMNVFAPAQN